MMNKILAIIVLMLLLCSSLLAAQEYDEKQVLKKQASQFLRSKQFGKAETAWKELINKYSDQADVVSGAFNFYISLNKRDEAKIVLELYGKSLPEKELWQLEINYLLIVGDDVDAAEKAEKLLDKYKTDMNLYRRVARLFEMRKLYDPAIVIYEQARDIAKDPNLYTNEVANALRMAKRSEEAVYEYVKLIRINNSYYYASKRYLLEMFKKDSGLLTPLSDAVKDDDNVRIQEIYATVLMQAKEYQKALDIYSNLDSNRLLQFANEQYRTGNDSLAVLAFTELLNNQIDPAVGAQVKVNLAKSYLNLFNLSEAERALMEVVNDPVLNSSQYRYRTEAYKEAREILARLALYRGEDKEVILGFLEQAKEFALNGKSKNKIEQSIIYHMILFSEFSKARERLNLLLGNSSPGTDTFKESFYHGYLIALNTDDPAADSLLTELIIQIPASQEVNDAIYLADVSGKIQGEPFKDFLEGWRLTRLLKFEEAIQIYRKLFEQTSNEEVLLAIADCYIELGDIEDARAVFEQEFSDPILGSIATLQLANLSESDPDLQKQIIIDFLTNNPQSAFAPEFRRVLNEN